MFYAENISFHEVTRQNIVDLSTFTKNCLKSILPLLHASNIVYDFIIDCTTHSSKIKSLAIVSIIKVSKDSLVKLFGRES